MRRLNLKMSKIIASLKFDNKILLKSRLLLGVFLIIYLAYIVNIYQSSIEFGDRSSKAVTCGGSCNEMYGIGPDVLTTKDVVVNALQQTTFLFIFPILIFLLRNRNIVYILTLLTIYLPIKINVFIMFPFILLFLAPLIIVFCITWIWESKKNNVANANEPILIVLLNNRILANTLILLIIAILMLLYIFGMIYLITYFLISLIAIFIILIWELKKWESKKNNVDAKLQGN